MGGEDDKREAEWQRASRHIIAGGICYDTAELLADVRAMVAASHAEAGAATA
ncbi:hypothetical protein BH10PSE18_BH10PSE18_46520 [soil metagenome]